MKLVTEAAIHFTLPICCGFGGGFINMFLKDEYSYDKFEKGFNVGIIATLLPTTGFAFGIAMMSNHHNTNYIMDNEKMENTIFNRFKSGFMAGFMHLYYNQMLFCFLRFSMSYLRLYLTAI
jgi:hypothetical protein